MGCACAGLILMAIGMCGLGYAAQRVIVATAARKARDALLSKASPVPYPVEEKEEASLHIKGVENGLMADRPPVDEQRAVEEVRSGAHKGFGTSAMIKCGWSWRASCPVGLFMLVAGELRLCAAQ